ncbi:hypothetical protein P5G51_012255 [Virgibacillus sp. 179-BFC.A HS]|uniref:Uncharacterized protein n=1 Tax=Tigheibacillus jepli TaxID=3035914 RepID=A0ABU5CKM3_9BACI|nr:hypothetical protein [Virgibacillus sp. 179-BFC.A HS]MDY0406058.1 hypothetical protein [Virgibacillus sp. 179-BFC.A HS]
MRELIGPCQICGQDVYCENGFFDGMQKDGKLLCNMCGAKEEAKENNKTRE